MKCIKVHVTRESVAVISAICGIFFLVGCLPSFSRPIPSDSVYIDRFLSRFRDVPIDDLQFAYHGAIGGELTVARFRIRGEANSLLESQLPNTKVETIASDSNFGRELNHRFAIYAGKRRPPSWLKFPFDRPLLTAVETGDGSDGIPASSFEWYVDKSTNTVYLLASSG